MNARASLSCLAQAALLCCAASGLAFAQSSQNDLRQFRVGMSVSALPATGYEDFSCAAEPAHKLASWAEFAACPKDAHGLHSVAFRYGPASNPEAYLGGPHRGTRVAGHPVLIALLINDRGTVEGIRIATDPHVSPYLRKKAFLFANQVKAHYGTEGWHCTDAKPADDEEPIGGVFIDAHCEKTTGTRRYLLTQQLFRISGQPLQDSVSAAELTILAPSVSKNPD